MRTAKFLLITMLLSAIAAFSITGTALGMEKGENRRDMEYRRELEKGYREELRADLEERGYKNCGITMTRVRQKGLPSEYTVRLHHRRMEKLNSREKEELREDLLQIAFPLEGDRIQIVFFERKEKE